MPVALPVATVMGSSALSRDVVCGSRDSTSAVGAVASVAAAAAENDWNPVGSDACCS